MSFLKKFQQFVTQKKFNLTRKRVLLAVSGGADSAALAAVFYQAKLRFEIAHCNFQLRGEEADNDEAFVRELAKKYNVPFHLIKFDTKIFAEEKKISIQQAARELRYEWFEKIRSEHKLDLIATAHHADDQAETILYQFIKGTGLRGLRGILAKRDRIIRPLLFAKKTDILFFLKEHNLLFRTDSSNVENKYARNKIRLEIMPKILEINPNFSDTILAQSAIYEELELLYNRTILKQRERLFIEKGNEFYIPILKLKKTTNAQTVLYEFLKDFGYNSEQVSSIFDSLNGISGKQFFSPTHRVIKDRTHLILSEKRNISFTQILLEQNEIPTTLNLSNTTILCEIKNIQDVKIKADSHFAFLDFDTLEFPLRFRLWRPGDYFYPFGMKMKKKKVSKFFKELKLNIAEKEQIWIVESNQKIVWVAGQRIDERFKITNKTQRVLQLLFEHKH